MNRTWLAAGILAALLVSGILVSHSISTHAENAVNLVAKAESFASNGNFEAAERICEMAIEQWTKKRFLLAAFLRHDSPESVEIGLAQLKAYAKSRDDDEFMALCAEVHEHLKHLQELEKPLLRNIL